MKTAIVTTFSDQGYREYGHYFVDSLAQFLDPTVDVYIYVDNVEVRGDIPNLTVRKLEPSAPDLTAFKARHQNHQPKNFMYDGVRFSHKSYCLCHCATTIDADRLIWIDTDTEILDHLSANYLESFLPEGKFVSYLGRPGRYTETGFLEFDLTNPHSKDFFARWKQYYDEDLIWKLSAQLDCHVFDAVREEFEADGRIQGHNLCPPDMGKGHFNVTFTGYMVHYKGDDKRNREKHYGKAVNKKRKRVTRVLLTGVRGFIGWHLASALGNQKSYEVIGVDRGVDPQIPGISYIQHDLTENCDRLPEVDMVIHLAAFNGTKHFYTQPYRVIRDNTVPTINLLDRYMNSGLDRFVYAGTPESTAGATDLFNYPIPTDEKCPLVVPDVSNPRWGYAGGKIISEQAVIASGIPYTIVRYNNVYGPRQVDHFISEFWERASQGVYELYGYDNTRTFLYIDDATEAVSRLISSPDARNQIVNVGGEIETTIQQVAELMLQIMNCPSHDIKLYPAPEGSARRRCPDVTKMKQITGMDRFVDLRTGLEKTIASLR